MKVSKKSFENELYITYDRIKILHIHEFWKSFKGCSHKENLCQLCKNNYNIVQLLVFKGTVQERIKIKIDKN